MDATNSLFRFAPHELSHSAFWAWILQSLNTSSDEFESGGRVATNLLIEAGAPVPEEKITVSTEYQLPGDAGRIDIHAVIDGEVALLVENKISERPSIGQLQSYESASEIEEAYYLLLSARYPTQEVLDIENHEAWKLLDAENLLEILEDVGATHSIVEHYHAWTAVLVASRRSLEEDALSPDLERRAGAMRTVPGQWAFMEAVAAPLATDGWQKSEHNASGGGVFTEFRFVQAEGERDNLFSRVEILSGDPVFRVEQYQQPPKPDWNSKKHRLEELRRLWVDSIDEAGSLPWSQRNTGAKLRCEIARLPLVEHTAKELREEFERVYPVFARKLRSRGWSVS